VRLPALTGWDALAYVRPGAAVDAVQHRELRPPLADDAERLAGRARDDPVLGAQRRQLELQAARAAPIAPALCKPDAVQFAERSCAAREAMVQMGAPQ
jgi:hypothetical protein